MQQCRSQSLESAAALGLAAEDMITIRDPETGRTARLSAPDVKRLRHQLTALTDLARRWCNLVVHDEADLDLRELLDQDPLSVLNGFAWILSAWATMAEARTGVHADEAIRSLDYQGPWRRTGNAAELQMWETMNRIVQQGALGQLTRDARVIDAFERNVLQSPEMPGLVLHHSLVLIDGLQQDMERHGLPTWQVAGWVTKGVADA